jgi:hypothetical protein
MQKYVNDVATVVDGKLEPLSNASFAVYDNGTSTLATIYSDNGITTIANPTTTSNTGRVEFYAADGRYDIIVSKTGYNNVSIPDIILDDPEVYTGPTAISVNNSSPALLITQLGAGDALKVQDSTDPDATPFVIDSTGAVVKGYSAAVPTVGITSVAYTPGIQGHLSGSIRGDLGLYTWSSNASFANTINFSRSNNNTIGTYTAVASSTNLGDILWCGADGNSTGSEYAPAVRITGRCGGTVADGSVPGLLTIATTAVGGTNPSEVCRVDNTGLTVTGDAAGLGYGTGSGGTVTQGTSRTTGVTLNKTNGSITLVSAAGSTTRQSFTVTNSTVAATDVVVLSQRSGTDLYLLDVTAVSAGSFRITFATTGGTTTEQPVFNFAVIKAVTA